MKKYNIAFTGVFDIENYGDHLFPLVFREKMKEKGKKKGTVKKFLRIGSFDDLF